MIPNFPRFELPSFLDDLPTLLLQTFLAEAVIDGALVRVAQHWNQQVETLAFRKLGKSWAKYSQYCAAWLEKSYPIALGRLNS